MANQYAIPQWQPAENFQQNRWNRRHGVDPWDNRGPRRTYPLEQPFIRWKPGDGWWRGNQKLRHHKPQYYWTRPNDGKRTGSWGRLKDALTGEGPDVFITITGDKRTLMRDRPRKEQWTLWPEELGRTWERRNLDMDAIPAEFMDSFNANWTNNSSRQGARYNFRTRKYEPPNWSWTATPDRVWRDAQWRVEARRRDNNPLSHQMANGEWWSRIPWQAGDWPGGRPKV